MNTTAMVKAVFPLRKILPALERSALMQNIPSIQPSFICREKILTLYLAGLAEVLAHFRHIHTVNPHPAGLSFTVRSKNKCIGRYARVRRENCYLKAHHHVKVDAMQQSGLYREL